MIRNLLSVGGFTLLSRVTGFLRDVMLAAVLGGGLLNDAFVVAFRLPNHFRAIFGEGAFNAAFVPSYSRVLETEGASEAKSFSGRNLHSPARLADPPARARLGVHADGRRSSRSGVPRRPRQIRPRGGVHAHQLSLSPVHHAGDAAIRRAQRQWQVCSRRLRAGAPQPHDDGRRSPSPFFFPTPAMPRRSASLSPASCNICSSCSPRDAPASPRRRGIRAGMRTRNNSSRRSDRR